MRWPAKTSPGARSAIPTRCSGPHGRLCDGSPQDSRARGRSSESMTRLRICLCLALIGLLAPATAHAAPEPGINLTIPFSGADLQNVKDSGAKTARFFMFYDSNTPGQFDGPVAQLRSIGVSPVFVVASSSGAIPSPDQYASFIRGAADHFKGQVAGWEIWNEEDAPKWWPGMPALDEDHPDRDASQYAPLLNAAYSAVKSADPSAPVIL